MNDLGYLGNMYTCFTTKRRGINVWLDRALGTQSWMNLFPRFRVRHLNKTSSDHVPILLTWDGHGMKRGKKMFRFEETCNMHDGCADVVRNRWEHHVVGSTIYQVSEKIKATRM